MNNQNENFFINKFKERLKTAKNKDFLIQNEIRQIEAFTTKKQHRGRKLINDYIANKKTNSVFDLSDLHAIDKFNDIFTTYLIEGEYEIDQNHILSTSLNIIKKRALDFADYYNWLKEIKIPKSKQKFSSLNNDQKLLALHYLFPNITDFTKRRLAVVLGEILNIGSENIRTNLSDILAEKKEIYNKENHFKLLELFEHQTFESITNKIEREIRRME